MLLLTQVVLAVLLLLLGCASAAVVVETVTVGSGPAVTRDHVYRSMVTLYIENTDKTRTPSGWSTRKEDGAAVDQPFEFQPGINLIAGWTEGVLQMNEGQRALLHVPSHLGYGSSPMGSPGGAFYIPADSDLLFDIEILGKIGGSGNESVEL
jgi:FKBP-type peptidyl-prolyl cis-trans isomerase